MRDFPTYLPRPGQIDQTVREMLLSMAARLERVRPDEPIGPAARLAMIQATTMDPRVLPTLRAAVPEITGTVIRRDYAERLVAAAGGAR
ncbi:hypothetical protein [Streptomyces sp. NPDC005732]|uniref:hypothetical protein n=1 Tax=Streptomyces sp. NPDC005732 TaxID=3157057 RepID=UPI0033FD0080